MKKRIAALCLMLVVIPVLTGCIRYDFTMKMNTNKTVDIRALFAAYVEEGEEADDDSGLISQEKIDELKEKGYSVEEYAEDNYVGCILSRKGIDIDKIGENEEDDETGLKDLMDNIDIKVDGKHVTFEAALLSEEESEESSAILGMLKSYGGYMNFNLEIPSKATKHNATSVSSDGKTLTWDLTALNGTDKIFAEFDLAGGSVLSWLIPVLAVLAVAVIAAVVIASRKKKPVVEDAVEEVRETAGNVTEAVEDKVEDVKDIVEDKVEDVKDAVEDKVEDVKDAIEDKVGDVKEAVEDKFGDVKEAVENKFGDVKDVVEDKVEDVKDAALDEVKKVQDDVKDIFNND